MSIESATYISDLNASYPAAGDAKSEGDDHLRLLKSTLKATFPAVSGAVTPTHTELNYVDGVTSAIQTQLDAKAPQGAASSSGLTMATGKLLGRTTASTGAIEEISVGTGLSLSGGSLSATAGSGGSLVYLSTVTASNSATMDIETTFDSTYDAYVIVVSGIKPASDSKLLMRYKLAGAYSSTNYAYHVSQLSSASASYAAAQSNTGTSIALSGTTDLSSGNAHGYFVIKIFAPSATTQHKVAQWEGSSVPFSDVIRYTGSSTNFDAGSALTGIRLLMSTGNITSGTARLYGIKNS